MTLSTAELSSRDVNEARGTVRTGFLEGAYDVLIGAVTSRLCRLRGACAIALRAAAAVAAAAAAAAELAGKSLSYRVSASARVRGSRLNRGLSIARDVADADSDVVELC